MTELVQYGTVQFVYVSGFCGFVQVKDTRQVSLMFNVGGRIPGHFPHLTGAPNSYVRYMRFGSQEEVEEQAEELQALTTAWCAYKTPAPRRRR